MIWSKREYVYIFFYTYPFLIDYILVPAPPECSSMLANRHRPTTSIINFKMVSYLEEDTYFEREWYSIRVCAPLQTSGRVLKIWPNGSDMGPWTRAEPVRNWACARSSLGFISTWTRSRNGVAEPLAYPTKPMVGLGHRLTRPSERVSSLDRAHTWPSGNLGQPTPWPMDSLDRFFSASARCIDALPTMRLRS